MKKLLLACLLFTGWSQAQNITFKDPEFKKVLIGNSFSSVDQNNDSEISIQEAEAITTLYLPVVTLITSIDEIKYFKNLTNFYIEEAKITSIDLSNLPKLKYLHCTYSDISTIDLSKSLELEDLDLSISDKLTTIDVSKNIKLKALQIYNTKISTLDLSKNLELVGLGLNDEIKNLDLLNNSKLDSLVTGTGLEYLNLKNGSHLTKVRIVTPSTHLYICADDQNIPVIEQSLTPSNYLKVQANSYCTFTPGGVYNNITGKATFNLSGNCSGGKDNFPLSTKFSISDNNGKSTSVTDYQGAVDFFKQKGSYAITPELENPNYFQISPSLVNFNLIDNSGHDTTINFCISPKGVHNDLEIVLSPTQNARPGFDTKYRIIYKNKGNQTLSGDFTVEYNDDVMDLVASSLSPISTGKLGKSFADLKPFEVIWSDTIVFKVNSPTATPAVNINDTLKFIATINPIQGDETPDDNVFKFNQIVVGAYDPNLITCLQGNVLPTKEIGKTVHYNIEFENTGNYPAENIVVVETIDPKKFDINSIQILNTSHPMKLRVEGNKVEYYFQNIDLGEHKHGNILLKLHGLGTLKEGDTILKQANIYFDYNAPVETNNEKTVYKDKLIQSLGVQGIALDESIVAFPNPSNGIFNLKAATQISNIEVYDLNGRVLQTILVNDFTHKIDLSSQDTGIYLVKVTTSTGANVLEIKKD